MPNSFGYLVNCICQQQMSVRQGSNIIFIQLIEIGQPLRALLLLQYHHIHTLASVDSTIYQNQHVYSTNGKEICTNRRKYRKPTLPFHSMELLFVYISANGFMYVCESCRHKITKLTSDYPKSEPRSKSYYKNFHYAINMKICIPFLCARCFVFLRVD